MRHAPLPKQKVFLYNVSCILRHFFYFSLTSHAERSFHTWLTIKPYLPHPGALQHNGRTTHDGKHHVTPGFGLRHDCQQRHHHGQDEEDVQPLLQETAAVQVEVEYHRLDQEEAGVSGVIPAVHDGHTVVEQQLGGDGGGRGSEGRSVEEVRERGERWPVEGESRRWRCNPSCP